MIGLIRQPKYGHLKELHRAIKLSERALVSSDPIVTSLGSFQQVLESPLLWHFNMCNFYAECLAFFQAHVYSSEAGDCAAFLSNYDTKSSVRVMFNNMHYNLPPWSISILPDCRNVVFNTAKVCYSSQIRLFCCHEFLPYNAYTLPEMITNSFTAITGWSSNITDGNAAKQC